MIKEKPCKGQNKAHGFEGCNKPTDVKYRKFGLCQSCYYDWMTSTEGGKIHYQKQFLPKVNKKVRAIKREEKVKSKRNLMSPDKYRAQVVQPVFNEIIRLIDFDNPCIAMGIFEAKMNAGHYFSVGSNRTIALNAHNVHIQSFTSNHWKSGDDKKYQEGIKNTYGQRYLDFMNGLKAQRPIKLSKQELEEVYRKVLSIRNDLKKCAEYLDPNQRILLRNLVNKELGIYDTDFSQYKTLEL